MSLSTPPSERPLRRDAERNRERILTAAREAFAEDGLDVGLHEIARRAAVGIGTVYRRFPDKDSLLEALFVDRIDEAVAVADAALADPDAFRGIERFLAGTLELQAADRGLHEIVFAGSSGPRCAGVARERMEPLLRRIVDRAQEEGVLRSDVEAADVGLLRKMLGQLLEATRDVAPDAWRRQLAIALDGLRPGAATPLPGRPLASDEFDCVVARPD